MCEHMYKADPLREKQFTNSAWIEFKNKEASSHMRKALSPISYLVYYCNQPRKWFPDHQNGLPRKAPKCGVCCQNKMQPRRNQQATRLTIQPIFALVEFWRNWNRFSGRRIQWGSRREQGSSYGGKTPLCKETRYRRRKTNYIGDDNDDDDNDEVNSLLDDFYRFPQTKPRVPFCLGKNQVDILEREFIKDPKPTTETKRRFAKDLKVPLDKINVRS